MPLQRTGLGQVGYDAQTLPSLPAIIAAQVWIAAMTTRQQIKVGRSRQEVVTLRSGWSHVSDPTSLSQDA